MTDEQIEELRKDLVEDGLAYVYRDRIMALIGRLREAEAERDEAHELLRMGLPLLKRLNALEERT